MNHFTKTLFYLLVSLFLFLPQTRAQHQHNHPNHRTCGTDEELQRLIQQDPSIQQVREQIEEHTQRFIANQTIGGQRNGQDIITIPVVVHIVYNTPAENLSFAQIQSQIDILNEDFRRLNSDTTSVWPQGDDAGIEFCLAAIDPNGAPTDGITRTQTNVTSFSGNEIKFNSSGGKDAWPRSQYMNMWVGDIGNGLLGFATLPGSPASTDGVVINSPYFGGPQFSSPPFNQGRTTTHEVGHWLNLLHTWGSGGCSSDDGVADTPAQSGPNYGCATGVVSCSSTDMVENYMDYSNDACMNLFTNGQKLRMRAVFAPGGFRESILSSDVCCPEIATCPTITSWTVNTLSDSSVQFQLASFTTGDSAIIRFAPLGTTNYDSLSIFSDTTLIVTGLDPCQDYVFGVQTACANDFTSFTCNQRQIATVGCCESPAVNPTLAMGDSSMLNWSPVYGALQYQVDIRELGASAWDTYVVSDSTFSLSFLKGCTPYELRSRSVCQIRGNVIGAYSPIDSFETAFNRDAEGCTQCQDTSYCAPGAITSPDAHVNNVQFGPIFQTFSGPATSGLDDFTGTIYNYKVDTTYIMSLNAGNQANLTWKVWIDLDKDGTFNDSTELIVDEAFPTNNYLSPLPIPADYPLASPG